MTAPPQPTPAPIETRHAVPAEIAANVREEFEALMATRSAARAVANAAIATAEAQIAVADDRYRAATRPILRQLGIDVGEIVRTEGGYGAPSVLVISVPAATPLKLESVSNG